MNGSLNSHKLMLHMLPDFHLAKLYLNVTVLNEFSKHLVTEMSRCSHHRDKAMDLLWTNGYDANDSVRAKTALQSLHFQDVAKASIVTKP